MKNPETPRSRVQRGRAWSSPDSTAALSAARPRERTKSETGSEVPIISENSSDTSGLYFPLRHPFGPGKGGGINDEFQGPE